MKTSSTSDLHLLQKREQLLHKNGSHNKSPPDKKNSHLENTIEGIKHTYSSFFTPQNSLQKLSSQKQSQEQQVNTLIESSQKVILQLHTVWPIDFFQDTLIIDPLKLTYTHQSFFMISYTESILIADLIETDVEISPIFATLRISFVSFPTRQILIKPLWKTDAQHAREIIASLRVAHRQHLQVEKLPLDQVEQLGIMEQHDADAI